MSHEEKSSGIKNVQGALKKVPGLKNVLTVRNLSIGDVLVQYKVITQEQYTKAMGMLSKTNHFSKVVVDQKFATEANVVNALNSYYHTNLTTVDEDTENLIKARPKSLLEKLLHLRLSIRLQLSLAMVTILGVAITSLSYNMLQHQTALMYQQSLKTGTVSLNYFANNARSPLLSDNILQLNVLIREASSVEGIVYGIILDRKGSIKAHTETSMLGKTYTLPKAVSDIKQEGDFSFFNYTDKKGRQVMDIARDVSIAGKPLGVIHVGVSLDFIQEQTAKERMFILLMSVFIVVFGIGVAILMGIGFSRPIKALAAGTKAIGEGNLQHRVHIKRNDELGDLAQAFNFMAADLYKKAIMEKSFGSYVSPEVLDMILENPENPWVKGTRNTATVLFTDVRGFTLFSEGNEPEVVVETLNEYFRIGTEMILEYNGYVDKFIGDAILGVFGVPMAQEDHAYRAVKASFDMQIRLTEAAKKKGIELLGRIGTGINSGVLVAGNIGSAKKMEYTVIGDTVNVASRLNGLAGNGEVIISRATLDMLDGAAKVEAMPPAKVKGKTEPIEVYKVLSIERRGPERPAEKPKK